MLQITREHVRERHGLMLMRQFRHPCLASLSAGLAPAEMTVSVEAQMLKLSQI